MSRELLKRVIAECGDKRSRSNITTSLYSAIIEYLEQPEPEPVAWMVKNHPANDTFVNFTPNFNNHFEKLGCKVTPLYTTPPDQSARIANLESELRRICDIHTEEMSKYHDLEQQFAALQTKREPLSDDEIRDCAESENLPYFENKEEFEAFARAIEAAHGIGEKS